MCSTYGNFPDLSDEIYNDNYDRRAFAAVQNDNPTTRDVLHNIFFLAVQGDEIEMSSMQDALTGVKTPWTVREALASPQRNEWIQSIKEEMELLKRHKTYELVREKDLPPGTHVVSSKIAFRLKLDDNNNPIRYKSRCVARGFTQRYGENYTETFQNQ